MKHTPGTLETGPDVTALGEVYELEVKQWFLDRGISLCPENKATVGKRFGGGTHYIDCLTDDHRELRFGISVKSQQGGGGGDSQKMFMEVRELQKAKDEGYIDIPVLLLEGAYWTKHDKRGNPGAGARIAASLILGRDAEKCFNCRLDVRVFVGFAAFRAYLLENCAVLSKVA